MVSSYSAERRETAGDGNATEVQWERRQRFGCYPGDELCGWGVCLLTVRV